MRPKPNTQKLSSSDGFSLIELMISLVIVLVILGFISVLLTGIQREFNIQRPRVTALNDGQLALDAVIRITRMAGSRDPGCNSLILVPVAPSIAIGSGVYGKLRVQADWNPVDCKIDGPDEDVVFSVSNGNFYIDADQKEPFSEGISALRFKFFDKSKSLISDPITNSNQIDFIEIEVETNDDTKTKIKSTAKIRSR